MSITRAEALDRTAQHIGEFGFFFDFDGTLSPIQGDPATVPLASGVREAIARLAAVARRVVIVSARPVAFLCQRFGGLPLTLSGMYGLELGTPDGRLVTDPAAERWIPAVDEVTAAARQELAPRGVLVEPKRLSVALHYRTAPQLAGPVEEWARRRAEQTGLRVQPGRMVLELRPPIESDKGTALRPLLSDLSGAWYVGDDVADLRAFDVLAEREREVVGFVAIRAAVTNGSPVDGLADAADFTVAGPDEVGELISAVAARRAPR